MTRKTEGLTTSADVPSRALRKYHRQNLMLAESSLESDPVELRDISATNMAIDPRHLPKAKKLIRSFRRKLSRLLEMGEKTEVYTLSVQLFPNTKRSSR